MVKTTAMILNELKAYANPKTKLSRMVQSGDYFPIVKGLYETNRNVDGYLLAGSIYGPSYLSFEFALSYYGMIPESVYTYTSATFDKKRKKTFETSFGTFTYQDVPGKAYPWGIRLAFEGEYSFQIATKEKAVCDKLYNMSSVHSMKEMWQLLTDNLRIDEEELEKLDLQSLQILQQKYHSTNVNFLVKVLEKERI